MAKVIMFSDGDLRVWNFGDEMEALEAFSNAAIEVTKTTVGNPKMAKVEQDVALRMLKAALDAYVGVGK